MVVVNPFPFDNAGRGFNGEVHGAVESVVRGQDFPQLAQGFLGTIFHVAGDQDHLFAPARLAFSGVLHPRILLHPGRSVSWGWRIRQRGGDAAKESKGVTSY